MKRLIIYSTIIICLTGSLSCQKAMDLNPSTSLSPSQALTPGYARQLMNGVYDRMQQLEYYGRDFLVVTDVGGDDVKITGDNSNRFINEFRYLYTPTVASQTNTWAEAYQAINAANNVIDVLPDGDDILPYKGEGYFVRALAHFDLARRFARPYSNIEAKPQDPNTGIPVVQAVVADPQSFKPARNTLEETYNAIIADLKKAQELCRSANAGSEDVFRGSKEAATALLVRVYLYKKDYSSAITEANKLIGKFTLWTPQTAVSAFKTNKTSEEIFTLRFTSTESGGATNFGYMYTSKDNGGYGDIRPCETWINLMDQADVRRGFVSTHGGIHYLDKFIGNTAEGAVGLLDIKILRISEIYLSRAEAYAETNDATNALNDLNTFRQQRGLSALATTTSLDDIKKDIIKQRRIEFIGEGHRMFDLFRRNETRIITDSDALGTDPIQPANFRVAYPISTVETDANKNIVQNPGYNQ